MPTRKLVFSSLTDTEGAAEAKRYGLWFDEYSAAIGGRDLTADIRIPFSARVEYLALGPFGLGRSHGSAIRLDRRPRHVARDGDDRFLLVLNRGRNLSEGRSRALSVKVTPGSATLFDFAEPSVHAYPGGYRSLTFHIPRRLMLAALGTAEGLPGTALAPGNEALRLLANYADCVLDDDELSRPAVLAHAGQALMDLAVLALGVDGDAAEAARLGGLRAARLAAVLGEIRRRYTDPDISPELVAARVGISLRYLYALLRESGTSFSVRVQELRLAKALALLSTERGVVPKVSDAAYAAGFNDLSHFNRLFRRKYGLTPTAARGRGASVSG